MAATLEGLSETIRTSLVRAASDTVTVELGLELAVKSGKLTGLLVEGEGSGSLAVTLEWQRKGPVSTTRLSPTPGRPKWNQRRARSA